MYAMDAMIYQWCLRTLLKMLIKMKNENYCCIVTGINKSEAIKLLRNIDLKKVAYHKYQEKFWSYKFTRSSTWNYI